MNRAKNTVIGSGNGASSRCYPDGNAAVLALLEIPSQCSCTWVPSVYDKGRITLMVRKYAHAACPAAAWHRRRQAVPIA